MRIANAAGSLKVPAPAIVEFRNTPAFTELLDA
jgi:hypothetical protein